jgi:hypothetical protein
LLDCALEPALKDHLARLEAIADDRAASDAFFDFRVADIAMGSGHFLVAAVDRIERVLSPCLANPKFREVMNELARLRASAREKLGPLADGVEIEDAQLLRRQIARRCIYGVDDNPTAVELARLSIWIHTFVPGLPLSFLDHNLVNGNSLIGVATVDEARDYLKEIAGSLFAFKANDLVGKASAALSRLGRVSDADKAEIDAARSAFAEARAAVAPAAALFDVIAAARIDADVRASAAEQAQKMVNDLAHIFDSPVHKKARKAFPAIIPFHFPVAFPEVFLRDRAGFDVIIGNPPWEEATVEEQGFWVRHFPGLRGMPASQKEAAKRRYRRERPDLVAVYESELLEAESIRRVLVSGPFPGMGTGDPDVYKAFAWRFWNLICVKGGRLGVVLPRSVFSAKGSEEFRRCVLSEGSFADLTFLLNSAGWVFDDAEYRYTIALCGLARAIPNSGGTVPLRGPFPSMSRYHLGMKREPARFAVNEVVTWTDSAALPLLPSDESAEVFLQLRKSPRLDSTTGSWTARPYAELHATNDKKLMKFADQKPNGDFWPVFKGESFDTWEADTGTYYSWANPEKLIPILQDKRTRSAKLASSPFQGFGTSISARFQNACMQLRADWLP